MNLIPEHGGYAGEPETGTPDNGQAATPLLPVSWADLDRERPERSPAVVDGILREGAVGTLISASKARKSWLVMALAVATACGSEWLGHPVAKGRVLLLDAELTRATLYFRLKKVAEAMGVGSDVLANAVEIFCLRGQTRRAGEAMQYAADRGAGHYRLIVIDPLSCFYPTNPDFSENSNSDMRRVCDSAITFAERTRAALMIVHHATKGAQNEKDIIDVGAGAGAVARSVDAHLILRRHRERDVLVLDGVLRDFPEMVPTCWRWNFPIYSPAPELSADDLAGKKPRKGSTAEFLAGGKNAKPELWGIAELLEHALTTEGQIIEQVILAAKGNGQKETATRSLLKIAVATGKAFEWAGKNGPGGAPKRYSKTPDPTPPQKRERKKENPPIPPGGAKSTPGRGKRRTHTPSTDASMRAQNTEAAK